MGTPSVETLYTEKDGALLFVYGAVPPGAGGRVYSVRVATEAGEQFGATVWRFDELLTEVEEARHGDRVSIYVMRGWPEGPEKRWHWATQAEAVDVARAFLLMRDAMNRLGAPGAAER